MMSTKKYTPKIRFAGFTDDWEQRKFQDLLNINNGIRRGPFGSALKKDFFVEKSDYAVYEQQNAIYDQFSTRYYITKEKFEELKAFSVIEGDFLVSGAGTIGKIALAPSNIKKGVFNQALIRLRIDRKKINPEYFLQLMRSEKMQEKLTGGNSGSAMVNLVPISELKNWNITIPPLAEQTAIGNFFKQLDETIALHQREAEKYKNLKNSYLEKMFPTENEQFPRLRFPNFTDAWEQRKLGELVNIVGGGTPDTTNKEFWNGDIDWYSPTEIGETIYAERSEKTITNLGLEKSSAKLLPANQTILFTSRASIGDMAILKNQGATNQGFQSFIIGEKLDVYFLYSMGYKIKEFALKNASGSTFLEISKNQLAKCIISLPNLEEQTAVGNFFKQLDETIALHQRKADKFKQIKQFYLEKMFI